MMLFGSATTNFHLRSALCEIDIAVHWFRDTTSASRHAPLNGPQSELVSNAGFASRTPPSGLRRR